MAGPRDVKRYSHAVARLLETARRSRGFSTALPLTLAYYVAVRLPLLRSRPFRFRWRGRTFWARPVDVNAIEEVLLDHEYAFAATILAEAKTPAPPTVIDAGANIGLFSLAMLAARPDAVVHALEPGARTFEVLRRNAGASPTLGWHVYPLALWKTAGPLAFGATVASTSSRIYDLAPDGRVEVVEAVTLSRFAAEHAPGPITLLKLDIEGAEQAVLEEAEAVLPRVLNLVVEIHPPRVDERRVVALLEGNFPHLHRVPGRRSAKPVMLASRTHAVAPW